MSHCVLIPCFDDCVFGNVLDNNCWHLSEYCLKYRCKHRYLGSTINVEKLCEQLLDFKIMYVNYKCNMGLSALSLSQTSLHL